MIMTKFSIITPCYNAERYIAETIQSVLNQSVVHHQTADVEYILCDGGSTDQTVAIAEAIRQASQHDWITIHSEPDQGMYDALAKGLQRATGDIIAYINAGDFYNPQAFSVVQAVFEAKKANWLTGYNIFYNEHSQVTRVELPFKYRSKLFACGAYGTTLPYIQQESTFWSSALNQCLDYDYLSGLKYAGDFYLWLQFSKAAELKIVESYLGGFKFHRGQLSARKDFYLAEIHAMTTRPTLQESLRAKLDSLLWKSPTSLKKRLNADGLLQFNHEQQEWI